MKLRIFVYLVHAAVLTAFTSVGCYTVLQHPQGAVLVDEYHQRRSCSDCHQASWLYHQDPYWDGAYYYGTYYPYDWWSYYGRPWWYDDYWYYSSSGESEPVEKDGRHMWSSPSLRPPDQMGIPPAVKVKEPKDSRSTSTKTAPADESKEKKEEKKRNLWDR